MGKLIVIEGTDGSGKGTQFNLAISKLKELGLEVETADFPQYDKPSAFFVSKYLRGEYGGVNDVSPRVASLFYALDRYDASFDMNKKLSEGVNIICNRYTTSSMGHQVAKANSQEEKDSIINYLEELEYDELKIPRPDKVLFVYMHPLVAQQLVELKEKRDYLQGQSSKDIHEADSSHLQKASESYLYVAKKFSEWVVIDCMKPNLTKEMILDKTISPLEKVKTIEEIHELVMKELIKEIKN